MLNADIDLPRHRMDALLNFLSYFFWVALALGILVFIHEMGHFLFARLFGMRVDAFSIGFPPVIYRKQIGATEYRIGAVPLGGYVKIAGMIDESMDADFAESEPQPDEFRSKPVWQRMLVISGGVIFNMILAFVIFIGLALWYGKAYVPADQVEGLYVADSSVAYNMGLRTGDRIVNLNGDRLERLDDIIAPEALSANPYSVTVERGTESLTLEGPDRLVSELSSTQARGGFEAFGFSIEPAQIGATVPGSPAEEVGLRGGDRIVAIDSQQVAFWGELVAAIQQAEGNPLALRWSRPDSLVESDDPTPVAQEGGFAYYEASITPEVQGDGSYVVGIYPDPSAIVVEHENYGLVDGVSAGVQEAWSLTKFYGAFVGRLITGRENVRESVGGPLIIAKTTKEAADAGGRGFWNIVAVLSIALAIFNILPIPVLDGGHLVFLIYEGITRREPSVKFRMVVQQVGFVLLLAFMAFVIFNDAVRWFG